MAEICRRCHADVTEDMALAPPNEKFECKCGSRKFRYQPEEPKKPYELSVNDQRLLKRHHTGVARCGRLP